MKSRIYLVLLVLFLGVLSGPIFAAASSASRAGRILTAENTKQAGNLFEKMIAKDLAGSSSAFNCGNFLKRLLDAAEEGRISEQAVKETLASLATTAEMLKANGGKGWEGRLDYIGKFIADNDQDAVFGFVELFAKNRSHLKTNEVSRFVYAVAKNHPEKDLTTLMKKMGDLHRREIPGVSYTHASEYAATGISVEPQIKITRHYAGLLSYLKADNPNALKGFINEIEAADSLLDHGYDVVQMGRRFRVEGKTYFSDIDIICRDGNKTFLVQCKVSGSLLANDIKSFSANLNGQLKSVCADFGPLAGSGSVTDLVIDKIRFLVPQGTMPNSSELRKIGDGVLDSLAKGATNTKRREIVNKFRVASGRGSLPNGADVLLDETSVLLLFIQDAPYSFGL